MVMNKKSAFKNFNPNDKKCGDKILEFINENLSKSIDVKVKTSWIDKKDILPVVTVNKGMDEILKIHELKIISFYFNVWSNDKKSRDKITKKLFMIIKHIAQEIENTVKFLKSETELSNPEIIRFGEKNNSYRSVFDLTLRLKVNIDEKEMISLKEHELKCEKYNKLINKEDYGIGGELIESTNKEYSAFKPGGYDDVIALIRDNKLIWKKKLGKIISFALANKGTYLVVATQLTEKEYINGVYRSGGHIYLIDRVGNTLLDLITTSDGLSCSISPDDKYFGVTTMGPEWMVYYFDSKGILIWNKPFDSRIGGIELLKNEIILYDKIHIDTRKIVLKLNRKGEIL